MEVLLGFGCSSGLMVTGLYSGNCVVFLGKTPIFTFIMPASLHSDGLASHPGGSGNTRSQFIHGKLGLNCIISQPPTQRLTN